VSIGCRGRDRFRHIQPIPIGPRAITPVAAGPLLLSGDWLLPVEPASSLRGARGCVFTLSSVEGSPLRGLLPISSTHGGRSEVPSAEIGSCPH